MRVVGEIHCWHWRGRPVCAYAGGSVRDRLAALSLFPRTSLKRRCLYGMMQLAVRLGLDRVMARMIDAPDALLSAEECRGLVERIGNLYGGEMVEWLITWPAMATRRRLYLVYRIPARSILGVAKIGAGTFNQRQLENEAAMLERLAGESHPFAVPSVRMQASWTSERAVLVLDGLPAAHRACSGWEAREAANMICAHLQSLDVPKRRVMLCEVAWGREVSGLPEAFDACFAHGDLGPGNMALMPDGRVLLYDWENASCEAPMETERVGFWLACNQRAVLREPQERYVDMVQEFSDVPEADIRFALAFLAAHDNLAASRMLRGIVNR